MSSKTTVIAQEELQRQFSYCDKIAAYWHEKHKRANVSASSNTSIFFIKDPPCVSKPILFPQKYRF